MKLSREITSVVNWMLDNLCPPLLRDSRLLMDFIIRFAYADKAKYILEFKEQYPFLTDDEIGKYYELIKDVPINKRKTDLNKKSLNYILNNIIGNKIIDVACGRGFLIEKISQNLETRGEFYGVDIIVPSNKNVNIKFLEGNITSLPFRNKEFDTVICTHALEHVRDAKKAFEEIMRIARRRVIIVVPCQREYKYTPDLHINFFPYMYRFKEFIGIKDAIYLKLRNDYLCMIDIKDNYKEI